MKKFLIVSAMTLGGIVVFSLVPSEPIASRYNVRCKRSPEQVAALQAREDANRSVDKPFMQRTSRGWQIDLDALPTEQRQILPEYDLTASKSGLRSAIEGRLAWLGFEHHLSFLDIDCK